jgi:transposase
MTCMVGIDVGARSARVQWRVDGRSAGALDAVQTPAGHAQLIERLQALKPTCVVLEATGIYYLDLAVALSQAKLPVAVINPKSFHHFAKLKLQGTKTDPVDAALLAEYAERMTPRLWTCPPLKRLQFRGIGRQINRLVRARTQARNRLHAMQSTQTTSALLIDDEIAGIESIDARIGKLTAAARQLLQELPDLAQLCQLIDDAKGFGQASAISILAELCVLPTELKANQVARYAGLDVRLCQSGTSVHKAGRMAGGGNAYLRSALFMPAMSARTHEPRAKAFFERLVAHGKKKMQALCALMRKYLTGIWACLKSGKPFDASLLFAEIQAPGT